MAELKAEFGDDKTAPEGLVAVRSAYGALFRERLDPLNDFSLYIKWQKQFAPNSESGEVCHALEYFRFIDYRNKLIDISLPSPAACPVAFPIRGKYRIASECGHVYHPARPVLAQTCPVCKVTSHLCFLYGITVAWDKAGGPRLRPGPHVRGKSYSAIRNGWHTARLQFQELLNMLEILFEYEKAWELKHPFEIEAARSTNCASAALKLALEESRYPAFPAPVYVPSKKPGLSPKVGKVTFAPNMQVKHNDRLSTSAIKFTADRPRHVYSRFSQDYELGSHACPPDSDFEDTSGTWNEPGDIKSLKIYGTDNENAFEDLQDRPHIFRGSVGEYQGLVGMHKLKYEAFDFLIGYIQSDRLAKEDFECLVSEADRITVLVDGEMGEVVSLLLFDGSDETEDTDDQRSVNKGEGAGYNS